jgi:hypothetical protein
MAAGGRASIAQREEYKPHFTYEQKKKIFMILHNIFWDDHFLIVEMS